MDIKPVNDPSKTRPMNSIVQSPRHLEYKCISIKLTKYFKTFLPNSILYICQTYSTNNYFFHMSQLVWKMGVIVQGLPVFSSPGAETVMGIFLSHGINLLI